MSKMWKWSDKVQVSDKGLKDGKVTELLVELQDSLRLQDEFKYSVIEARLKALGYRVEMEMEG